MGLVISIIVLAVGFYTICTYLFPPVDDSGNALSRNNITMSLTVNPVLSIATSTNSLVINNLVPGTTRDSNTVTVTVASNIPDGYVLSAGVGSADPANLYYNTSDLIRNDIATEIPSISKFSSIDTSASLQTLTADNTWGYSTSADGGASWSTYSGLPHTVTKPLLDISDPAQPSTIDFKIAARSATAQASGTFGNVITFYVVGKPRPVYMQESEIIKAKLQNIGDELQAIDQRDGKKYWIRKMADGNIWMTQNLDLELSSTKTYTPADTDVSANWRPTRDTIEFTSTSLNSWDIDNATPYSANPGEIYYYTSGTTTNDSEYASLAACQAEHPDCSAHNHVGNYYNWSAAVASNNTNTTELTTMYNNAPDSICPAGWRLPTGRDRANTAASREGNALLAAEGIMTDNPGNSYATNGSNNIRVTPLWLARSGNINGGSIMSTGSFGSYWSSTVINNNYAYASLYFNSGSVYPTTNSSRNFGYSIRCLIK